MCARAYVDLFKSLCISFSLLLFIISFLVSFSPSAGGNQDGKFSVGFRDGVVRTVVNLDRETVSSYTLILEAIGRISYGVLLFQLST